MKKLLFGVSALVLAGVGCLGLGSDTSEEVKGGWLLSFDLPDGWVMVAPYSLDQPIDFGTDITPLDSEVYIQSTGGQIYPSSGAIPNQEDLDGTGLIVDDLILDDYIRISVSHLDPRRLIPEGAEDLGDGFYKEKICEDNEDCRIGGALNYNYYLETEDGKYKFVTVMIDRTIEEVEGVIFSAREVTATE
ncbi:MAG: hypothetical protein Q8P30_00550 [Candidatus Uhrbacteria bacterium]|nr:hypothetical protein [Candidatus Uhrbacteria bacterium]